MSDRAIGFAYSAPLIKYVTSVYTGPSLTELTPVASSLGGSLGFFAHAQTPYYFAIDLADQPPYSASGAANSIFLNFAMHPAFTLPVRKAGNIVEFGVVGSPGRTFALQESRDLVTWVPLRSVLLQQGEFRFQEVIFPTSARRFYRAVPLP
jgi:hypothetical protein